MSKFYKFLVVSLLCSLVFPISAVFVGAQQGSEAWSMFHYDLAHTGVSSNTAPSSNQTLWAFTTGDRVWSSPAVADGKVYVGSFDHYFYALDASNGNVVWKYLTDGMIYPSPAVANGIVYFGSNDKNIYALNAGDGSLIWKYTTGDQVQSSPMVY